MNRFDAFDPIASRPRTCATSSWVDLAGRSHSCPAGNHQPCGTRTASRVELVVRVPVQPPPACAPRLRMRTRCLSYLYLSASRLDLSSSFGARCAHRRPVRRAPGQLLRVAPVMIRVWFGSGSPSVSAFRPGCLHVVARPRLLTIFFYKIRIIVLSFVFNKYCLI